MLIVAGDDPGDPTLVTAAATGVRRGARVVVAAPYEGPLRDATAGRAAALAPRLWVPDEFALCRYLAAGLATLHAVDAALQMDLAALADELDAEALRNSAGRELFTNAAKALADRISGRSVVLAGDSAATLALARHGSATMVKVGRRVVAATGLADALVALRACWRGFRRRAAMAALFHDEEIDGPLPERLRVLALTLASRTSGGQRRVWPVSVTSTSWAPRMCRTRWRPRWTRDRPEQQLAMLAVRLEMAAVYLRLAG